jgi:pSer/pThr/pTyr-binding forkhead associated (FHA) protein
MRVQPARARQAYRAVIIAGPRTGDGFLLSQLPAVIGRSAAANIFLAADMSISRQHAEIYDEQGTLRIRDLNSTHGTLVNGFSIQDKSLDPGDRIQIGATVLLIQEAGG